MNDGKIKQTIAKQLRDWDNDSSVVAEGKELHLLVKRVHQTRVQLISVDVVVVCGLGTNNSWSDEPPLVGGKKRFGRESIFSFHF